jgi:dihydroflavonol-4-reductase
MPAYLDTGLNVVHVDDVAQGHLLAHEHGRFGERYILGGDNLALRDILAQIAAIVGRAPPRVKLPIAAVLPAAYVAEALARITRRPTTITVEAVRMASKRMYFASDRAVEELGYRWRAPRLAFEDAIGWFREQQLMRG